ncbi:hypothetical protein ACFOYW_08290 [Gryllotalpicola reticulitermitis]|uniref:Uncharacterized protein n=1 Tax=Gryllotalpicola reticulitermitis TaxID=1184153 RepID=A0ABV8Q4T6_9MICO
MLATSTLVLLPLADEIGMSRAALSSRELLNLSLGTAQRRTADTARRRLSQPILSSGHPPGMEPARAAEAVAADVAVARRFRARLSQRGLDAAARAIGGSLRSLLLELAHRRLQPRRGRDRLGGGSTGVLSSPIDKPLVAARLLIGAAVVVIVVAALDARRLWFGHGCPVLIRTALRRRPKALFRSGVAVDVLRA